MDLSVDASLWTGRFSSSRPKAYSDYGLYLGFRGLGRRYDASFATWIFVG